MNRTNSEVVKIAIEQKLDAGIRDKRKIISEIVEELGVSRPTVRRIARELRNKYLDKVKILQSDFDTHYRSRTSNDDDPTSQSSGFPN